MAELGITFNNKTEIRVQAQIYAGRTLISSSVVAPGEIRVLPGESLGYDIFFKNSATGWEIARKLGSNARTLTLSQNKKRYTLDEANERKPLDPVTNSELTVKRSTK